MASCRLFLHREMKPQRVVQKCSTTPLAEVSPTATGQQYHSRMHRSLICLVYNTVKIQPGNKAPFANPYKGSIGNEFN